MCCARKVWEFYAARDTSPSSDEIRREQYADLECSELINFLLTETVPPNLFGQALKRFVTVASACYTIRDGLLFRIQTDPRAGRDNESLQLVIPVSLREAFLEAWHERMGHPGIEKTYQLLRARVYWRGLRGSVEAHVSSCHECAVSKKATNSSGATCLPEVGSIPWEIISADVLTMPDSKPVGKQGIVYSKILLFCDSHSKWVELFPFTSEPTAAEIMEAFFSLCCRFGVPRALCTDRGSPLIATLCREVHQLLGVDLRPSAAHHHETLGQIERANRTLLGLLRASPDSGASWPLHLPFLAFMLRTTVHDVTKRTPAFLNYGRELRARPTSSPSTKSRGPEPPSPTTPLSNYRLDLRRPGRQRQRPSKPPSCQGRSGETFPVLILPLRSDQEFSFAAHLIPKTRTN